MRFQAATTATVITAAMITSAIACGMIPGTAAAGSKPSAFHPRQDVCAD